MPTAKKITEYCQEYLKTKDFEDYCYNGCQVEGASEVKKIITGVSLSQKLIEKSAEKKAQMIIVHHGFFGSAFGMLPVIKGVMKNRLKLLFENNINLLGFHLPLDAHAEIGNNISICRKLNIKKIKLFDVGFIGELKTAIDFEKFICQVDSVLETKSYSIQAGPSKVKRVGVISGGSSPKFQEAKIMGADTYLCGDVRENTVREVEEANMNFINAGHYNTEKLGVQNLANLLVQKFNVEAEFIDIPNEI